MTLRLNLYRFWFRLWMYMLPLIAFAISAYIHFFHMTAALSVVDYNPVFYFAVLLFTTVIWSIIAEHNHLCDVDDLFSQYTGTWRAFSCCATTCFLLVCVLFFYRHQDLSRIFFSVSAVALFTCTVLSRVGFRYLLRGRYSSPRSLRVLIVGTDADAVRLTARLREVPIAPSQVVAHIRLPGQQVVVSGPIYELEDLAKGSMVPFDDVVIALPPSKLGLLSDLATRLKPLCAPIRAILDFGDVAIVRDRLFQFGDLQMLDLATAATESPHYFVLKRIFDIVFALCVIIFTGPLMLLFVFLIKFTSPGPVLFRQRRVGLNGQSFTMYKFRSMRISPASETDTQWANATDSRRTAFGNFLRRSGLDELPQFFNVLKGEMSVVGPRPERPFFVSKFLREINYYNTRHRLKVGITGWAQVNGWRGDTSIQKRLECDLYYIQNWSFLLDLRIAWLTIWLGLFGENAR